MMTVLLITSWKRSGRRREAAYGKDRESSSIIEKIRLDLKLLPVRTEAFPAPERRERAVSSWLRFLFLYICANGTVLLPDRIAADGKLS